MGRTFQFECPHCQYRTLVSGGADRGVNCAVQTILCRDCHRLFDVLTRVRQRADAAEPPPVPAQSVRTRLPVGVTIPPLRLIENPRGDFLSKPGGPAKAGAWHWIELKPGCPVAAFHRIEFWNEPGRCPRCGSYLEKNAFPYRLWD
jgi:hypothetical protein